MKVGDLVQKRAGSKYTRNNDPELGLITKIVAGYHGGDEGAPRYLRFFGERWMYRMSAYEVINSS